MMGKYVLIRTDEIQSLSDYAWRRQQSALEILLTRVMDSQADREKEQRNEGRDDA